MARYLSCKSLELTIFKKQNDVLWTENLTIFFMWLNLLRRNEEKSLQRKTTNSLTCIPITIRSEN